MENALKKYLSDHRLTVADLVRITGVPYMNIRHHVKGRNLPSVDAALKYERLLGIPISSWSKEESSNSNR
jgi:plasmid maintenance system antidote protein VapI